MLRFSDEIDLRTSRLMKKTTLNSILHIPFLKMKNLIFQNLSQEFERSVS